MAKASPKPGLGKKTFSGGSSGSGNVTPIRNQSVGKTGPYANAGSASRQKSGGRISSRQGQGANIGHGASIKSQGSGEYMARTTLKEQKNNLSMSLKSNESNSDNKVPQVPSA